MVVFVKQVVDTDDWGGNTAQFMSDKPLASFDQREEFDASGTGCLPRDRRVALLNKVVAAEILPRLAQVRRGMNDVNPPRPVTTETDTLELVRLLLDQADPDISAFIDALRLRGASPDMLYIGILSDAARELGELWTADRCDFVQVTVGLGRLQQVARHLSPSFQADATRRSAAASILLLPAPGEQHTFGLLILSEFFHRAGWIVAGGASLEGLRRVRDGSRDLVRRCRILHRVGGTGGGPGPDHRPASACLPQRGAYRDGGWPTVSGAAGTGCSGRCRYDRRGCARSSSPSE